MSGLHARSGSIKRTPSDLSRDLAQANLPPPSAITTAAKDKDAAKAAQVNQDLENLDLDEPEGEWELLYSTRTLQAEREAGERASD